MSIKQMVKANLVTQLIWVVITFVVFYVIGFVSSMKKTPKGEFTRNGWKFTKDGFKSDAMQDLYDRYNKVKS